MSNNKRTIAQMFSICNNKLYQIVQNISEDKHSEIKHGEDKYSEDNTVVLNLVINIVRINTKITL